MFHLHIHTRSKRFRIFLTKRIWSVRRILQIIQKCCPNAHQNSSFAVFTASWLGNKPAKKNGQHVVDWFHRNKIKTKNAIHINFQRRFGLNQFILSVVFYRTSLSLKKNSNKKHNHSSLTVYCYVYIFLTAYAYPIKLYRVYTCYHAICIA